MTRDEFESILEEVYMIGYEDAESELNRYYLEQVLLEERMPYHRKEFIRGFMDNVPEDEKKEVAKALVRKLGKNKYVKDKDKNLRQYFGVDKDKKDQTLKEKGIALAHKLNAADMATKGINSGLRRMSTAGDRVNYKYNRWHSFMNKNRTKCT